MKFQPGKFFLVLVVAGVIAFCLQLVLKMPVLQAVFAIPLVLLLPGHVLTQILLPRYRLGAAEGLLFSLGLSIVLVALIGLLLHWTSVGLDRDSWLFLLVGIASLAGAATLMRRPRYFHLVAINALIRFRLHQAFFLGLAAVMVVAAFRVAAMPAPSHGLVGYTMFWIQVIDPARPGEAYLGVTSKEFTTTHYRVQFNMEGRFHHEGPAFQLQPGETHEFKLRLPAETQAGPLTIYLYRLDDPMQPYRQLIWWPPKEKYVSYHSNRE